MQPIFNLVFEIAALASALGVTSADTTAIMTDARTATPIVRHRIAAEQKEWTLAPGNGGSDDLRDRSGGIWRVKSITGVIQLAPSKNVGSSRSVNAVDVAANWDGLAGYLLLDIAKFPKIAVYCVPIATVRLWRRDHRLRENADVSRGNLMKLLAEMP